VIDPKSYRARATYLSPQLLSAGTIDVIVNGRIELENGKPIGILSGRAIRKEPLPDSCP
jgi:N-acyl-D-aspartate/D-glutamate deacylase